MVKRSKTLGLYVAEICTVDVDATKEKLAIRKLEAFATTEELTKGLKSFRGDCCINEKRSQRSCAGDAKVVAKPGDPETFVKKMSVD